MKKLKVGDPELVKILINKMTENHDIDYDFIMENQHENGIPWCCCYEWTQEESDEYKKWFIEFFQKSVTPKRPKYQLAREWQWFNLMYGLRIKDENRL